MLFSSTIQRCFAICFAPSFSGISCPGGSFTVPSQGWSQQVVDFGTSEG